MPTLRTRSRIPRHALWTLLIAALLLPSLSVAQTVDIGGFVKSSYYYDTRQIVGAREGDFVLYPTPDEDTDGDMVVDDGNDTGNLLFFPFFSRLSFAIGDVPDVAGAEMTGYFETDFYGKGNADLNSLRIRRAFVKMDWGTHEAVFGMDWSPTFIEAWPRVTATEAGVPYQSFSRNPQARFTFKPEGYKVAVVAMQQRDAFAEISGIKTQQQAELPTLMLFAEIDRPELRLGFGVWNKWIRPTLLDDTFTSLAYQGFLQWQPQGYALRAKVTYGESLADQLMTGGYIIGDDGEAYGLQTLATWGEFETTGPGFNVGIFGGYFSNLGAGETVTPVATFTRGDNIESGTRFSPRATYTQGKVKFALEFQIDTATYAAGYDAEYAPDGDTESYTNFRTDFSVFLFF